MIETLSSSAHHSPVAATPGVTAARILSRLRETHDWQEDIGPVLEDLARSLSSHRAVLFRLLDAAREGIDQSVSAYWSDEGIEGISGEPTVISQDVVNSDPLLERLAEEVRQGKIFAGHTSAIEGFLRYEFEARRIKSFLSVPVFVYRNVWGTLAINDCVRERDWTREEQAAVEIAAIAIGESVERTLSDEHISEHIRHTLMQLSYDAIIVIDQTGSVIEFNPAAERMLGWRRDEIMGKDMLPTIIPERFRDGYATGGEYMTGRGAAMVGTRTETIAQNRNGQVLPIEITVTEMRIADRRYFIGTVRDLSERKRADEEIGRQREKLHQNEKMAAMGSLLAGVSHELNNPLAVVVAQSTLLHEFAPDAQTKARAEKVRAAAERCGRIVKSFLGMVRVQPATQAEANLNQIVRSALELTAYGARSSGINIEVELAPGPLRVMVDADQIAQVAANLLINSQHALMSQVEKRRITVRTYPVDNRVGFVVEDNGPGIAKEVSERIFESYFTTKAVGVGTGIGLSISRTIVERHGGRIWFENVQPTGARFVVELPAHRAVAVEQTPAEGAQRGIRHALVIDDESDVASSLADMLQLMGVEARIVTSWKSVAASVGADMPDIVFSDLRMPGTNGMAIYRDFLEVSDSFVRRFVLVTGDLIGARAEIEALPMHERPQLLEKPFQMLDVRGVLAAVFDQVTLTR